MAIESQTTRAMPARMNVGSAAVAIRSTTSSPELIERPRSPCRTPLVAPEIAVGRKLGSPVGPMKAAGVGNEPSIVPSVSGLHSPIQRQYWIGMGWSSPHAFTKASFWDCVIRGLFANFAWGPPGAASRIPYTTTVIPNRTGIAWIARRITNFVIGVWPHQKDGAEWTRDDTPGLVRKLRGPYTRWAAGAADMRRGARQGAPSSTRVVTRAVLLLGEPVLGVPGRADLGAVGEVVADPRAGKLDVLAVVERDLDGLLHVELLERRHRVLDDVEVDVVLDVVHRLVDVGVAHPGV